MPHIVRLWPLITVLYYDQKNKNETITGYKDGFVGVFQTISSKGDEDNLCAYILRFEEDLLGVSRDDVRHIA